MAGKIKIAPSILASDFLDFGRDLKGLEEGNADYVHFDVMDGKFVPEISFGEPILRSVRKGCSLFTDVHLMIEDPYENIESFANAGADMMTFHIEAAKDPNRVINRIKSFQKKAGIALRPDTPVERVYPFLQDLDMILVMTVYPGFGGQKFMPSSLQRIRTLRDELNRRGLDTDIQVDGGINASTVKQVYDAGANVFVAGSYVFKGDMKENISRLKELCNS